MGRRAYSCMRIPFRENKIFSTVRRPQLGENMFDAQLVMCRRGYSEHTPCYPPKSPRQRVRRVYRSNEPGQARPGQACMNPNVLRRKTPNHRIKPCLTPQSLSSSSRSTKISHDACVYSSSGAGYILTCPPFPVKRIRGNSLSDSIYKCVRSWCGYWTNCNVVL